MIKIKIIKGNFNYTVKSIINDFMIFNHKEKNLNIKLISISIMPDKFEFFTEKNRIYSDNNKLYKKYYAYIQENLAITLYKPNS